MKESKEKQKKRWKKESNQLKEDLNNRQKIIKKRKINLKLANPKPHPEKQNDTQNHTTSDNYLRKQLGL
tara:strand:- start:920 stop:1126 length:207 start_codon:yes stop_codon:yes gene_type:complete